MISSTTTTDFKLVQAFPITIIEYELEEFFSFFFFYQNVNSYSAPQRGAGDGPYH